MASKSNSIKKGGSGTTQKTGSVKPRMSAQQKKMRRQQVGMAIFALVLVVAMILSLVVR